jgi:hypothetical protein
VVAANENDDDVDVCVDARDKGLGAKMRLSLVRAESAAQTRRYVRSFLPFPDLLGLFEQANQSTIGLSLAVIKSKKEKHSRAEAMKQKSSSEVGVLC